ncbi:hypothetical protein ZOD2009_15256 [Haladaptatus paucihalophilus DX253]|uniref:Uncharacterized protein n=1 Tax=Haladaptatus paucihalophilus DX253 TaxID=797209 RepID=E7QW63_HALPU|nr:hypothetical protein ZOD2009_15256 [Haladaptatus paucihalophilus DX253]
MDASGVIDEATTPTLGGTRGRYDFGEGIFFIACTWILFIIA